MGIVEAQALAREYFRALRRQEWERIFGLLHDQASHEEPVGYPPRLGRTAIVQFLQEWFGRFKSYLVQETSYVAKDDQVVVEWRCQGTWPDDTAFSFRGISVFETGAGKIRGLRTYWQTGVEVAVSGAPDQGRNKRP